MALISVIMPAHDESATIERGLSNIVAQSDAELELEVLVVANGCSDDTVARARSLIAPFAERGVDLVVIDHEPAGKTAAMNVGDERARGEVLFYCDADIAMAPGTIAAMVGALAEPGVRLVSATQRCVTPGNRIVRGWARCYHASPYQRGDDVVHGLFALARTDRERFGPFPETMADDRFLMVNFAPAERKRVAGAVIDVRYTESVAELIDQQARWVANNSDIDRRFPELVEANAPSHANKRWPYFVAPRPSLVDMASYGLVTVAARWRVRRRRSQILGRWDRARPA